MIMSKCRNNNNNKNNNNNSDNPVTSRRTDGGKNTLTWRNHNKSNFAQRPI